MSNPIPGFWDVGPHDPFPVEKAWRTFVRLSGGTVVEDELPQPRTLENADFLFPAEHVVAELKIVETEFMTTPGILSSFDALMRRVVEEDPNWRPRLFGGDEKYPSWFYSEFIRIFRPPISRILKKANRQIRETNLHFGIDKPTGVLIFVNDGFTTLGPEPMRALACDLLLHSYSSIDCLLYLTANRYVAFPGDETPRLLWAPSYSERASGSLSAFVDNLGRKWFDFLEPVVGTYTDRAEQNQELDNFILKGSYAISPPQ